MVSGGLEKVKAVASALWTRPAFKKASFGLLRFPLSVQRALRSRRVIVYYNGAAAFERKANAIADLLRRHRIDTTVLSGLSYRARLTLKTSPDLFIGFWNHVPLDWLPETYIAFNAEPLRLESPTLDHQQLIGAIRRAKAVWNYSHAHLEIAQQVNPHIHFVPFGYASYYEKSYREHTSRKDLSQDIDVLFYGGLSERRKNALTLLQSRGMKVHVADPMKPVHGEKLDELIGRSKIVLGIHYYDDPKGQIADFARLDHLLSNRVFVVHERPSTFGRDPGFEQNVTTCEYAELADVCRYFIERPEERAARSEKAYFWFKSEWPLDAFIPYEDIQKLLRATP